MAEQSLLNLAIKHFQRQGYDIERNVTLIGVSGLPQFFDLSCRRGEEVKVVYVKDWVRSVGVNMTIKLDNASEDVGARRPVLVAKSFSSHAHAYANRHGVTLLTPKDLSR